MVPGAFVFFVIIGWVCFNFGSAAAHNFGNTDVPTILHNFVPYVGLTIWAAIGTLIAVAITEYCCHLGHQERLPLDKRAKKKARVAVAFGGGIIVGAMCLGIGFIARASGTKAVIGVGGVTALVVVCGRVIALRSYTEPADQGEAAGLLSHPVGRKWTHLLGFTPPATLPLTFSILWCTVLYNTQGFILSSVVCMVIGLGVLLRYGQRI